MKGLRNTIIGDFNQVVNQVEIIFKEIIVLQVEYPMKLWLTIVGWKEIGAFVEGYDNVKQNRVGTNSLLCFDRGYFKYNL